MFTPLLDKIAEPPPPEGVSVKEWDRILQKGPDMSKKTAAPITLIRALAEREQEKRAFEELTSPFEEGDSLYELNRLKQASAADPELLKVAHSLALRDTDFGQMASIEDVIENYEQMGGTYKHAFGQQMFDVKQMAGSPAVSGGMNSRAKTPMPQMQQSPVSVTTTSIGQTPNAQGGVSQASPTSQTSTPSAPTG